MKLTPEDLRTLYRRETSGAGGEHPDADVLARLLSGDVSAGERATAVSHLATCARCAEEVRVARPVGDGLSPGRAAVARPLAWRRPAFLVAAAACVLVAGGLAVRSGREPAPADAPFRAPEKSGLSSLLAANALLPRGAPLLRWAGAPPNATFEVVLANERLDILARIPGVRETQLAVPPPVLAALPHGARLVWQVTVVLPDGTRTVSRSFVNAVE